MAELMPKHSIPNFKDQLKKERQERKRTILYLIESYLNNVGLFFAAEQLRKDAQLDGQYQVCDNVDLDIILQEYQSYYCAKFQQTPKVIKKVENDASPQQHHHHRKHLTKKSSNKSIIKESSESSTSLKFDFEIVSMNDDGSKVEDKHRMHDKMKLSDFESDNQTQEWREMAALILKDAAIPKNLGYKFDDCIGLERPVELLKEATIYPLQYKQLFEGDATFWTGILLFGPPGTGKTLLARALACETPGRFINVASSTFISKWRGDSEKMIKVLFEIARFYAPSTIFIDELDAITCSGGESNHEASKRFKSELLTQIDGIMKTDQEVFVLATTNSPWKLDAALLRRFEKRIFVPLPTAQAKRDLFKYYIKECGNEQLFQKTLHDSDYYSGCDIKNVCKEAKMIVIREAIRNIKKGVQTKRTLTTADLIEALAKVKPCLDENALQRYVKWNEKYGCV